MFLFDRNSSAQYADATRSVSAADLGARVQKFADMIEAEGLSDARICLPLDSGVNALAALIAVMEQGVGAALVPMPTGDEAPLTPPFCDAVVTPAAMDAEDEAPSIERLRPASDMPSAAQAEAWRGHVWLHTSGSTGVPKWLLQRCDRLHRSAKATGSRLKLTPEDRVMTTVPINHSFGLGAAMMSGLVAGSSVRMAAGGNPLAVFQAQRSFEPTVMFMVPSQVRSILALRRKAGRARVVVVSGDKLLPSEAAAFEPDHGPVVCFYGSSETNAMTASSPDDPMELRHHTVGYPLDGVTLQLEDSADEEDLVMRVDASCRFSGYCDPETGLVVDPAPDIWKTGDLIRLHDGPDGQKRIEVLGRADHAVKRDGLFVHLGKIEECISDAEGVESVAVVVSGMTRRGVGLVAFCQTDGSDAATADAILAHARAALPPRAVPDRIAFIDNMPLLDSGKLNRRQLTALADSQEASDKAAG